MAIQWTSHCGICMGRVIRLRRAGMAWGWTVYDADNNLLASGVCVWTHAAPAAAAERSEQEALDMAMQQARDAAEREEGTTHA